MKTLSIVCFVCFLFFYDTQGAGIVTQLNLGKKV